MLVRATRKPFLTLQLSYGLSTEYTKKPQATDESKFDADRQLYSKYYVSQIMQMGEEGIHDAWHKVSPPAIYHRLRSMNIL